MSHGLKNGGLLAAASGKYDVLVTVDQNIQFQQSVAGLSLAIILLKAPRSTLAMLKPLMPMVLQVLSTIKHGELVVVG